MTCRDGAGKSRESFHFVLPQESAIGCQKENVSNARRASPRRAIRSPCQTKSIRTKHGSQRPARLLGFVWVLEHHKPVTMLFLRSVDLGVERFCFLGITNRKIRQDVSRHRFYNILITSAWEQQYLLSQNPKEVFGFCSALSKSWHPQQSCEGNVASLLQQRWHHCFRKWVLAINCPFQYWLCTDPQEVLLGTDTWSNEMISVWPNVWKVAGHKCSWCKTLLPVAGWDPALPSTTPAVLSCEFYASHGEKPLADRNHHWKLS